MTCQQDDDHIYDENQNEETYELEIPFEKEGQKSGFSVFSINEWSTFFGPQYEEGPLFKRGMYGKDGQLMRIGILIQAGFSIRQIAYQIPCSKNTVIKLRRVLERIIGKEFMCLCGQPIRHKGWCHHRFAKSKLRQKFMEKWNKNKSQIDLKALQAIDKVAP